MNIGKGKYGNNRSCAHARMIMRECPYCGSELPDDKNAVYCVNCDHIIDEDFLLRQKIKKELEEKRPARMKERPKKDRKQPPAPGRRRGRYDYVKTLGTVIRKAREEQGLSQASLAEKLGIDVRTIINIENFRGNPKFEVLYPLITTLRIPADRIFYPGSDAIGDAKQQLFWELHNCSESEARAILPAVRYITELLRGQPSDFL